MIALLVVGVLIIAIGLMMIFAPATLYKINAALNKKIFTDKEIFKNKTTVAVIYIAVGFLLVFTYLQYFFR
ncbi:hypothetical protein [Legionella impletisoli]|uniref:Uncharacterized protein n=1 Tax=Legionella impletisoli TaxID=343510 RepID=A0A917JTX6_9GAMM|nr:hypothetical protein [Legionella impletisoli]GGI86926.1 hypothetical protein GCM10007966_14520 [Legionella impletisoli]